MLTLKSEMTENDGGITKYYRNGSKFVRTTSHHRGGLFYVTQIFLKDMQTAQIKIVETTSALHTTEYLESLWDKHLA